MRVYFETKYFKIGKCLDCSVPGYLILSYKGKANTLAELPNEALAELGYVINRAHNVLNQILKPEKIYTAMFGESSSTFLHFHIFPRTISILKQYQHEVGDKAFPVNGPILLTWARHNFKSNDSISDSLIDDEIQQAFKQAE